MKPGELVENSAKKKPTDEKRSESVSVPLSFMKRKIELEKKNVFLFLFLFSFWSTTAYNKSRTTYWTETKKWKGKKNVRPQKPETQKEKKTFLFRIGMCFIYLFIYFFLGGGGLLFSAASEWTSAICPAGDRLSPSMDC